MSDIRPLKAEEIRNLQPGEKVWFYHTVFSQPWNTTGPHSIIKVDDKYFLIRGNKDSFRLNIADLTNPHNGVFLNEQDAREFFKLQVTKFEADLDWQRDSLESKAWAEYINSPVDSLVIEMADTTNWAL